MKYDVRGLAVWVRDPASQQMSGTKLLQKTNLDSKVLP